MKIAWRILLAMVTTLSLGGCRALSTGSLAPAPGPLAERGFDVEAFVAAHNRNADRIQSLEAKPSIHVAGKIRTITDGRMAMERPRNFKLEMRSVGSTVADIGSNDDEFWFWVKSDGDKAVYWCNYQDLQSSALAVTYQPDWIVESLGLKPITPEEAAGIRVRTTGVEPGTTALVFEPTRAGNETIRREIIVWNNTRRIKEHRVYAGKSSTLVVQAEVSRIKEIEIGSTETNDRDSCYLPESIKLDWKREQLVLDVTLKDVHVNEFNTARSADLFVRPRIPGYVPKNLADMNRGSARDTRTTVRQTMPRPQPRTSATRDGRSDGNQGDTTMVPRLDDRPMIAHVSRGRPTRSELETLVGAPLPAAPD